jgi:nucleoid-associated protein YgaU
MTEIAPQAEAQNAPRPELEDRQADFQPTEREWRCRIVSRVDGLNIRERASGDSRSYGHLDTGESLPAGCEAVSGEEYQSCGGSYWWIPVRYEGRRRYVAWACLRWFTSEPPQPERTTYVVQRGDTLSSIARRFRVSLSDLEDANPQIDDPNRIFPGQVINIP